MKKKLNEYSDGAEPLSLYNERHSMPLMNDGLPPMVPSSKSHAPPDKLSIGSPNLSPHAVANNLTKKAQIMLNNVVSQRT